MKRSDDIIELASALSKAQGKIEAAKKDSENPHFKTKYADLASVWNVCRAPLSENGLSIVQSPVNIDGGILLETMLMHQSGQWITNEFFMPITKQDAHGVGTAITYARRYVLSSMLGIASEGDDDGNHGSNAEEEKNVQQPQRQAGGQDATFEHVGTVEDYGTKDVGGGRLKYFVKLSGLDRAASTLSKALGDKIGREKGTNMSVCVQLKRFGQQLDLVSGDIVPPNA